jgi:hypothetical protein
MQMNHQRVGATVVLIMLTAVACGGKGSSSPPTTQATVASRPSSPAKINILSPRNGQVIHGHTLSVHLSLQNAHIVKPTTSKIDPRKGHIHVLLDGSIVSMNYGLKDTISKLSPGTHTLRVEFVASDHLPFDPRVFQEVAFEVKP